MVKRLLPLLLALLGLGAGAGAGLYLRPDGTGADAGGPLPAGEAAAGHGVAAPAAGHAAPSADGHAAPTPTGSAPGHDYVKLNNQFVVPVVENGKVAALVILSLSLEVTAGSTEAVYQIEPKLRDAFLQVMFDHANAGGFRGTFTDGSNMVLLRQALREAAQKVMGKGVSDVLIVDLVRQDN